MTCMRYNARLFFRGNGSKYSYCWKYKHELHIYNRFRYKKNPKVEKGFNENQGRYIYIDAAIWNAKNNNSRLKIWCQTRIHKPLCYWFFYHFLFLGILPMAWSARNLFSDQRFLSFHSTIFFCHMSKIPNIQVFNSYQKRLVEKYWNQ